MKEKHYHNTEANMAHWERRYLKMGSRRYYKQQAHKEDRHNGKVRVEEGIKEMLS